MTRRRQRLLLLVGALSILGIAAWLVLSAFQKNLVFFFTPSQVIAGEAPRNKSFRMGGMVEAASLKREADGVSVSFIVTDTVQRLPVRYTGILPDLFKEGKGVVAQGKLGNGMLFLAEEVLAKHDENYMPPEAAYALEQGKRDAAGKPQAAGGIK
ncbi:MAG: cytochrome c maturation protein CcmE [Pseudomonadota bacterium]